MFPTRNDFQKEKKKFLYKLKEINKESFKQYLEDQKKWFNNKTDNENSNWKVNKGQRIIEIEQESVKKYIKERKKIIPKNNAFGEIPQNEQKIETKNLTIKQRLRTELLSRPSFIMNDESIHETDDLLWHNNLTANEKRRLLNSLAQNYQKFKRITDKSNEKGLFMPKIKRKIISANFKSNEGNTLNCNEERAKTCAVFKKGEDRIKRIFEGENQKVDDVRIRAQTREKERKDEISLRDLQLIRKCLINEANSKTDKRISFQLK